MIAGYGADVRSTASNTAITPATAPKPPLSGAGFIIAATSSRSSWDSRAGTLQSSVTAPAFGATGQVRLNSRRSAATMLLTRKLHPTSRSGDHHPSTPRTPVSAGRAKSS